MRWLRPMLVCCLLGSLTAEEAWLAAIDGLLDPAAASHSAVADGAWHDPATWGGSLPGDEAQVHIPAGRRVQLTQVATAALASVLIEGELSMQPDADTGLTCTTLVVASGGTLELGNPTAPIAAGRRCVLTIRSDGDAPADPYALQRGLLVRGTWRAAAERSRVPLTWTGDLLVGQTELVSDEPATGWVSGDPLLLPGLNWDADQRRPDDSLVELAAVSGSALTLAAGPAQDHRLQPGFGLRLPILNLARAIELRSADGAATPIDRRGHVLCAGASVAIRDVVFRHLGRSDQDQPITMPDGSGGGLANPGFREPLFFYRCGAVDGRGPAAQVANCLVWQSPSWAYGAAVSRVDLIDCASYDVVGAHVVAVTGDTILRVRGGMLATARGGAGLGTTGGLDARDEVMVGDLGKRGFGCYAVGSLGCDLEGVTITGCADSSIYYAGKFDGTAPAAIARAALEADLQALCGDRTMMPGWALPLRLVDCTVYNCRGVAHIWGHMRDRQGTDSNGIGHEQQAEIEGVQAAHLRSFGLWFNHSSYFHVRDSLFIGDPADPPAAQPGASNDGRGTGIYSQKNSHYLTATDVEVVGFGQGLVIQNCGNHGADPTDEIPYGQTVIDGGRFADNTVHFAPAGALHRHDYSLPELDPPPFSYYADFIRLPSVTTPAGDRPPLAAGQATAVGGLTVLLDAVGSDDPDATVEEATGNHNDCAGYIWHCPDGSRRYGRQALWRATGAGRQVLTLEVIDRQGSTATTELSVDLAPIPFGEVLDNPGFTDPPRRNSGGVSWGDIHTPTGVVRPTWEIPGGSRWQHDPAGHLTATASGAQSTIQVVHNRGLHRGAHELVLRYHSPQGLAIGLRIWGVDGRFAMSNWNSDGPTSSSVTTPFGRELLLDHQVDTPTDGWTYHRIPVDLGGGWQWFAVQVIADAPAAGEELLLDRLSIVGGTVDQRRSRLTTIDEHQWVVTDPAGLAVTGPAAGAVTLVLAAGQGAQLQALPSADL